MLALASPAALASNPAGAAASNTAPMTLYLETTLDGTAYGLQTFELRGAVLYASAATLRKLHIRSPASRAVPLRSFKGLVVRYDSAQQALALTAPLSMLDLPTTVIGAPAKVDTDTPEVSPGALVNYMFYGTSGNGSRELSGYLDGRVFGRWGVLDSTELLRTGAGGDVRLDTAWTHSWPDKMLTLRVGDTLTAPIASWARQVRIGGVQIGTDFATQPYLSTAPLLEYMGSATVPSNVQLFIDGQRYYSGKIPAGPYSLTAHPGLTGAGTAQVIVQDALGQSTAVAFPIYGTPGMLRPGLTDWSATLGFVRQGYGIQSDSYAGTPVAAATWRRGITPVLTIAAHGEMTAGLVNVGTGGDWRLGWRGGVASWSVAGSRWQGKTGAEIGAGYSWTSGRFSFGAHALRASDGYRDLGSLYGSPMARLTASATASVDAGSIGQLGVGYTALEQPGLDARYASLTWRRALGRHASLELVANQNLEQHDQRNVFLALNWNWGARTSGTGGVSSQGGQTFATTTAQESAPSQGGWGWRAEAQNGGGNRSGQGEIDWRTHAGYFYAGAYDFDGHNTAYAAGRGSLVWMDHHLFVGRMIQQAFGVVSTSGVPSVPVKLDNDPEGETGGSGLLLVPALLPYQRNQIAIDPLQLPANARIGKTTRYATPIAGAGVIVPFAIARIHAATVTLTADSKPVPVGSVVRVKGAEAYVGYAGETYIDTLAVGENTLDVTLPTGTHCIARVDYPVSTTGIARLAADCARDGKTTHAETQP